MTFVDGRPEPVAITLDPEIPPVPARVEVGTAFEALVGLMRVAGHRPPGEYELGKEWLSEMKRAVSAGFMADIERLCAGVPTVFGHLVGLVDGVAEPRDLTGLVTLIEGMSERELRMELLGFSAASVRRRMSPRILAGAADGDAACLSALLASAASDPRWQETIRGVVALDPGEAKALTVQVLRGWGEVFARQEAQLGPRLIAEAERWQGHASRFGWSATVERATMGILVSPEAAGDGVVLVPTVLGSPWVYVTDTNGAAVYLCPVRDEPAPTGKDLVRVLRALADESRLRVLRRLATSGPATLPELTTELGLAKSTVHKHVMALRAAGLITVMLPDRRYALRELPDLNALLGAAVAAPQRVAGVDEKAADST